MRCSDRLRATTLIGLAITGALVMGGGMAANAAEAPQHGAATTSDSSSSEDSSVRTVRRACAYEYQGRCYTWLTDDNTCRDIFATDAPMYRKTACAIYANTGIRDFEI